MNERQKDDAADMMRQVAWQARIGACVSPWHTASYRVRYCTTVLGELPLVMTVNGLHLWAITLWTQLRQQGNAD